MLAPIIGGVIQFIQQRLSLTFWDGEIPRWDLNLDPIDLTAGSPLFKADMLTELTRDWTLNNAYGDGGPIGTWVMATTRSECELTLGRIEELFCAADNWALIDIGGTPFKVFEFLFESWSCKQLEGVRTRSEEYIYLGLINWGVAFHGEVTAVQTGV